MPQTESLSWGRYPRLHHASVLRAEWADELDGFLSQPSPSSVLPYGLGRSYGDSCLNGGNTLLDCSRLDRIAGFDPATGKLECEAGISLRQILDLVIPRGWFLPVTPGTKFVTLGGAIANDVHGKNHHGAGTFGRHVESLLLQRSDRGAVHCNPDQNNELFSATIGGLGLTGVISSAKIRLIPIASAFIVSETIPFTSLTEFQSLSDQSDSDWTYTVAWIDCLSTAAVRGIFFRGRHAAAGQTNHPRRLQPAVRFEFPDVLLNRVFMRAFNAIYYQLGRLRAGHSVVHYEPFFYPLDAVRDWNLVYGKRGFVQYQCVIPETQTAALQEIFNRVAKAGSGSFLAVLKRFGAMSSPGMMSFPRPGLTLALDFPLRTGTLELLDSLDEIVISARGAVYPAKDARMSSRMFEASFPHWRDFARFIDPQFSSSFWRRVTGEQA